MKQRSFAAKRLGKLAITLLAISGCTTNLTAPASQSLAGRICSEQSTASAECELRAAMATRDEEKISEVVDAVYSSRKLLAPERTANVQISFGAPSPTQAEVLDIDDYSDALKKYATYVSANAWWHSPPDNPANYPQPLRAPAYIAESFSLLGRNATIHAPAANDIAANAGEFLIIAKNNANGVIAFPDWRENKSALGDITRNILAEAQKHNMLDEMLLNDWIVTDPGDGSLYFDNGVVGEAFITLYESTGDSIYLNHAIDTARWAMDKPVVPNFNYNAFSAVLLARIAAITDDREMMEDSLERLKIGVLSGMIRVGERQGHWIDPHNDTLVYRMIMARALIIAASQSAKKGNTPLWLGEGAELAITAIEKELTDAGGLPFSESAVRLYCSMTHENIPGLTFSQPVMRAIQAAVRNDILSSSPTLSPAALGCFIHSDTQ